MHHRTQRMGSRNAQKPPAHRPSGRLHQQAWLRRPEGAYTLAVVADEVFVAGEDAARMRRAACFTELWKMDAWPSSLHSWSRRQSPRWPEASEAPGRQVPSVRGVTHLEMPSTSTQTSWRSPHPNAGSQRSLGGEGPRLA